MKKAVLIPIFAVFSVMLLLYPQNCIRSAQNGLNLWLYTVLPALFPFMVSSFMMLETGIVRLMSFFFAPVTRALLGVPGEGAYVFMASLMSGYPVGARLAGELYAKGHINEPDAQRIICFTSVAGPVFLTGAIGTAMLNAPYAGIYLASAHYLSAFITGIFLRVLKKRVYFSGAPKLKLGDALRRFKSDAAACPSIGAMMSESVEKSLRTLLKIGGFVILFSVIIEILEVTGVMRALNVLYSPVFGLAGLDSNASRAILSGGIEITAGCAKIAALSAGMEFKLLLVSSVVAFGGACVQMQTRAVLADSGLKPKRFLLAKSLHSIICVMLITLFLALFPLADYASSLKPEDTKTAAFGGVIFAALSLSALLFIKLWQSRIRKTAFPSAG
ncbi:MAG: nucleoside recognition domain-containing protein [Christensenellales bacterium]